MNYVGQLAESVFVTVKELYKDLNPATLTGCIDVVVVRQPDNSFKCSPFHVRFGKLGVLRSREKVVDIEINGEPVDLRMKLGDNGEAFFVQEREENEGSIPSCLCTSPIPMEQIPKGAVQLSHGQEATGPEVTQRKRRRRRRKPKRKEVLDSESESCDEIKGEMPTEEPCKVPAPRVAQLTSLPLFSGAVCSSFANVLEEETSLLQSPEMHSHSDGELASMDSLRQSRLSSPKSDSELEIKSQDNFASGADSHMQWTWGKLPQTIATAGTSISAKLVPVDEATPLVATSESLGEDPSPAGHQDIPCSSAVSVIETTLAPQDGNNIPSAVGAENLLGASSVPQETQEGDRSVQPDVEPFEGATAPRQAGSEGSEHQQERQRNQGERMTGGSIKRSPHLGPSDIYLEDLSNLDEEHVALYFPRSDKEQSLRPVTDPSNPLCVQLPSSLPADTPPDSDSMPTVALSLCGGLRGSRQITHEKFMEHVVSYQQFAENPRLVNDPNLVILINNQYYSWPVAGPMVLSLQAFHRNIPENVINDLVKEKMPRKSRRWWFWRRRELPAEEVCLWQWIPAKLFPSLCRQKEEGSSSDEILHSGKMLAIETPAEKPQPTYKKSLRLSSEQIVWLNLQDGPNEVVFSVTTQYQGTCRCEATIYLWNWDDKVVISDIDGTITKSDALGHILPHLGKDWTHQGIVKLFHKIHMNGYKFLYCSARAIGMSHMTKVYLTWVNDQGYALPRGPILLSPSSLLSALHREVIERKPEVFKVDCLMDIQNLFATKCPFHAAFGNRPNDVYTYRQVGLPESRIFTVNSKGELIQGVIKNHKST
ncbi:LPIN3 phosphatase, partial [Xiphorhynchus elegans]|nr:LPIN3 phosphatase [Xiphorhynchus elegans]